MEEIPELPQNSRKIEVSKVLVGQSECRIHVCIVTNSISRKVSREFSFVRLPKGQFSTASKETLVRGPYSRKIHEKSRGPKGRSSHGKSPKGCFVQVVQRDTIFRIASNDD